MNLFQKIWTSTIIFLSDIHWRDNNTLQELELAKIKQLLAKDYYVILTRKNNHLTTYLISFADYILRGKFGFWGHALMNLEDTVKTDDDYLLIEAIGSGVQASHFNDVFEVNSVALLKPKNMTLEKWTAALDKAKTELGKPYDNLFDLKSDKEINCVELVRLALSTSPTYNEDFAEFEGMIAREGKLTPSMFYDCPDFEVAFEVRRP